MPKAKTKKNKAVISNQKSGLIARFKRLPILAKLVLVLSSILVISVLGLAGYSKYEEQRLIAKAGSYTTFVSRREGVSVYACNAARANGVSLVRVLFVQKGAATNPETIVSAYRNGSFVGDLRNRAWFWSISVTEILVRDSDTFVGTNFSSRSYRPPSLRDC